MRYCVIASSTQNYKKLYQIASEQDGYFTTKQAKISGYDTNSHSYHVKSGNWIREHRGIYRLSNYPMGERPELMLWYLWSRNRQEKCQGIYSHETALSLFELTDINPSQLHMTVPKNFRRNSQLPPLLILYFDDIPADKTDHMHGVKVASPMRTIMDIINEGTYSNNMIMQSISEALSRGLITKATLEKEKNESRPLKKLFDKMML